MATDITDGPISQTLDLTGLPEPVVRDLRRLVETLRVKLRSGEAAPATPPVAGRPLRGIFAEPGLSIPREQIDEAQREVWAGFPRDFPGPPKAS